MYKEAIDAVFALFLIGLGFLFGAIVTSTIAASSFRKEATKIGVIRVNENNEYELFNPCKETKND